jgi:hypothetical protein
MKDINDSIYINSPADAVRVTPPNPINNVGMSNEAAMQTLNEDPLFNSMDLTQRATMPLTEQQVPFTQLMPEWEKRATEKPSYFRGLVHEATEWNLTFQTGAGALSFLGNAFTQNPALDYAPPNWTPINEEAVQGIPEQYRYYIADAKSPMDQMARRNAILERMRDAEYWDATPWPIKFAGGALGVIADPVGKFLPAITFAKYGSMAQDVALNTLKNAPKIGLDAFSRRTVQELNKDGSDISDAATNGFIDSVYAMTLVGTGRAAKYLIDDFRLKQSLELAKKQISKDVTVAPVINEKGIVTGYKAQALDSSVGAASVKEVQELVDFSMAQTGVFGLPVIGEPLYKSMVRAANLPGVRWLSTPGLIAEGSSYKSVRNFLGRLGHTGAITKAEEEGIPIPTSAAQYAQLWKREAIMLNSFIKSKFMEANGLNSSADPVNAMKELQQRVTKQQRISWEQFGMDVQTAMYNDKFKSEFSQVHEVAKAAHEQLERWNVSYNKARNAQAWEDPRWGFHYFPSNYFIQAIKANPQKFVEDLISGQAMQYEAMQALKAKPEATKSRINNFKNELKAYKSLNNVKGSDNTVRRLENEIKAAQKLYQRQYDEMIAEVRDNWRHHLLLEDRILFDSKELQELKNILQPSKEAKTQVDKWQTKKLAAENDIVRLNKEIKEVSKRKDGKRKEAAMQKKLDELSEVEKGLKTSEAKLKEWSKKSQEAEDALFNDAIEGKIPEKYLKNKTADIQFHDPDAPIKFRNIAATYEERKALAEGWKDVLTNNTPEHILDRILGHEFINPEAGANYAKEKTIMLPGDFLSERGWLSPNIMGTIENYANVMGKVTGFRQAFPEFAEGHEFSGVIKSLKQEHDARLEKINADHASDNAKRIKELGKADREFKDTQRFMSDMMNVYYGKQGSSMNPNLRATVDIFRNMTVAAKTMAIPIYQASELGAIVMKQQVFTPWLKYLKPTLKSYKGWQDQEGADFMRKNAHSALVGINHQIRGIGDKISTNVVEQIPIDTPLTHVRDFTAKMANVSGNFAGTNYITNVQEMFTASVFQSSIVQAAHDELAGTLSKLQMQTMARYGIDIKRHAQGIVDQFNKYGFKESSEGYMSKWWNWDNNDLQQVMREGIFRACEDTIIRNGMFNSPLWTYSPIGSALFMFKGWSYAAFNRYTLPFLQRPNAQHTLGIMTLFGLSLFTEPALKMINGQDPYPENEDEWFASAYKALDYSGIAGPLTGYINDINLMTGLFPQLKTERMKYRESGFNIPGPIGGYMNDMWNVIYHASIKGDMTERDMKKFVHTLPFLNHIALRNSVNSWVESLELPKTRKEADPFPWFPEPKKD